MGYISGLTVSEGFYRAGDARGKCRSMVLALLLWHCCLPQWGPATRFAETALSLEPSAALGTRGEAAVEGEQWSHAARGETGQGEGVWDMQ